MRPYRPDRSRTAAMKLRRGSLVLSLLFALATAGSAQVFQITDPAEGMQSSQLQQLVRATASPGGLAELWMNGEKVRTGTVRGDGVVEFVAVPFPQGTVEIEVRIVAPSGAAQAVQKRTVHIFGAPRTAGIRLDRERLFADGSSTALGTVEVMDEWGYIIPHGVIVTIDATGATVASDDVDPRTPGVQRFVENGAATFAVTAGTTVGPARITARTGRATASFDLPLDTPLEPFTLVGLVNGTAAANSGSGDESRLADGSMLRRGFDAGGRMAVYARGTIGDDYLLTASFDSDRRDRNRLFRELDPDHLYSMYGDNSMLYYDVQTNTNLFARLEKNRSFVMLGEFGTDLTRDEFSRYQRSLNGLKVGHEDRSWTISGFGALTDRRAIQREIRGEGLSGFYMLGATDITVGSERVRIETRDRFQSHVVLSERDQSRFSDYEIDYQYGTIFFKQPVPAMDADGNPVWIVVTFEARTGDASSVLAGGRVERTITEGMQVGVTGIVEQQEPSNYTLVGSSVRYAPTRLFSLTGEVARSNTLAGSGMAYKVESSGSPMEDLTLRGYYRDVEEGFTNTTQSGGRRETGTEKFGLGGTATPLGGMTATADWYRTFQSTLFGRTRLTSFTGAVEQTVGKGLTGKLSLEDVRYVTPDTTAARTERHSTLLTGSASYGVSDRLRLTAQHEQNLGRADDATRPSGSSLLADYKITDDIVATGSFKVFDSGGSMSSVGLRSTVFAGTEMYGRYEISNAIGGRRNMMTMGLKNAIKLPYDLTASFGAEHAKDMAQRVGETPTQDHTALSAGLEYLPADPVKASTKVEFGDNTASRKMNVSLSGTMRVEDDFSVVLKLRHAQDRSKTSGGAQDLSHVIAGLAYRPVAHNDLNVLAKVEYKADDNRYIDPFLSYAAWIASVHTYVEPVRRVEVGIKVAYRAATEETVGWSLATHTNFVLLRGSYDITDAFDAALEYRALMQAEANDILSGYSVEVGYALRTNLRLVAGYNFKGYRDRDLIDAELSSSGPFIKASFKFGEDLFGF